LGALQRLCSRTGVCDQWCSHSDHHGDHTEAVAAPRRYSRTGAVVWELLASVPWLAPIALIVALVVAGIWIYEQAVKRTKPGDSTRVNFFGVVRVEFQRGLSVRPSEGEDGTTSDAASGSNSDEPRRESS
jgi:hypothetical protein